MYIYVYIYINTVHSLTTSLWSNSLTTRKLHLYIINTNSSNDTYRADIAETTSLEDHSNSDVAGVKSKRIVA